MTDLIHSQNYDSRRFSPSMPIVTVGISRAGDAEPFTTFDALVDTGADATLIPSDLLDAVQALFVDRAYLRGVTGQRERIDLFLVTIYVPTAAVGGEVRISGIRAVAVAPGEFPILGRDVINHLRLSLDGPAEVLEIYS
jgi:predicted aspartyl protease